MIPKTPIGSILKELRGKRSLREIEKLSDVSYGHIRNIENGMDPRTGKEIKPSPEVLKKLAHAYNFPHDQLMYAAGYYYDKPPEINQKGKKIHFVDEDSKEYFIERSDDIYQHTLWVLMNRRAKVNGHVLSPQESDRFARAFKVFTEAFFPDYLDKEEK